MYKLTVSYKSNYDGSPITSTIELPESSMCVQLIMNMTGIDASELITNRFNRVIAKAILADSDVAHTTIGGMDFTIEGF